MMNQKLPSYLNLCTQVYDLSKPLPPPDDYAFYRSYAASAKGPILEPMCGTGRFLLPLMEEGFDVHGFDASGHMLRALSLKAKSKNLEPRVRQGFFEDFRSQERYGLVFIPSGSFGLIVDYEKARDALVRIHEHLQDNGVLVFEAETPTGAPAQTGMWQGSAWPRADGKQIISSFLTLPLRDNVSASIWRYELVDGSNIIQTEIEIIRVRHYDPGELTELVRTVGFTNIKMVKAFDRSCGPDSEDAVIVYECSK